jgi:hypothetical protein
MVRTRASTYLQRAANHCAPFEVLNNKSRRTLMKTLNTKVILSALGIVAMLSSPAFAQKPIHNASQEQSMQYQTPVQAYHNGDTVTGSASNRFEQENGFYAGKRAQ